MFHVLSSPIHCGGPSSSELGSNHGLSGESANQAFFFSPTLQKKNEMKRNAPSFVLSQSCHFLRNHQLSKEQAICCHFSLPPITLIELLSIILHGAAGVIGALAGQIICFREEGRRAADSGLHCGRTCRAWHFIKMEMCGVQLKAVGCLAFSRSWHFSRNAGAVCAVECFLSGICL